MAHTKSSVDGSSDEGRKYQEKLDYQDQEVVSYICRNPRRIIRGDQRALTQIEIEIDISEDKPFFIKIVYAGSTQAKWYLVQVDMDQSDPVLVKYY